ncbi:MAG: hypothetical protein HY548_10085, partial [Elusimicrobia bacterium]|nr:hypothetical protein [Elusimicrobiota bacterium]
LAGGGFLTQKQHSRSASVKGIYALSEAWRGKIAGGWRQQLVKETSDESWGDGLFDTDKLSFGFEAERIGQTWKSKRIGLDYYTTKFPNYQSLASKQFGSEIKAGTDVLNFNALDVSWGGDLALGPKSLISTYILLSNRAYPDQKIVKANGVYSSETRKDMYSYFSLGYRRQLREKTVFGKKTESLAGLDVSAALSNSNQNNYDASRSKFNTNYYDYSEFGAGPRFNMRFNEKLSLGLGYMFTRRAYADRPVQKADGTYPGNPDSITTNTGTFRWSVGYPLMKNLSFQVQGAFQSADSNMDYETVYQYSYSSSHYFAGLSYQL